MLPISVKLTNKKCIVVGGGKIAYRRTKTLLEAGAHITIISPELLVELRLLVEQGRVEWLARPFDDGDCIGAFLVITATNRRAVNARVAVDCQRNQLINMADDPENSNFHFPAIGRKGALSIAVSTEGTSPVLAKTIRDQVMEQFDDGFEQYMIFAKEARELILSLGFTEERKRELLKEIVDQRYIYLEAQQQFLAHLKRPFVH
ncbi:NAD(P)-dependent oxidoreductase [Lysinibacillus sp. KU-BSD001]|uniref:precorrin-2 dehydrogenase/sirohydrochlorin ferrochelatase family protein n=1 Tax=Lysinibacillus sp. KU-BSD001 TaxID=3141328 RepID=UPI0036E57373